MDFGHDQLEAPCMTAGKTARDGYAGGIEGGAKAALHLGPTISPDRQGGQDSGDGVERHAISRGDSPSTESVEDIVAKMWTMRGIPVPFAPERAVWLSDYPGACRPDRDGLEARREKSMTLQECHIVAAFTGVMMTDWDSLHKFAEERLGHPIWTHEFAQDETVKALKEAVRPDFLALCKGRRAGGEG